MSKRTYITTEELDVIKKVLLNRHQYKAYVIVLCLSELRIKFKSLQRTTWDKLYLMLDVNGKTHIKEELIHIRSKIKVNYGNKIDYPVQIYPQHFNKVMKETQEIMGTLNDYTITTKTFSDNITLDGLTYYGYIPNKRTKNIKVESKNNYLYVMKYSHRDKEVSEKLTDKKIGLTNDIISRKKQLTLGPIDIECIGLWKVEVSFVAKIEKVLHKKYKERHIIGEWFEDPNNDLLDLVRKEMVTFTLLDVEVEEQSLV